MIHETCSPWVKNVPYWFWGKRSRSWGIGDWKRFPDHYWLWNPPMIMKLHTPAPYESKMCLIDFGLKGLGLLRIEIIQGCSMLIQRIFATRIFASLMHPLLVFFIPQMWTNATCFIKEFNMGKMYVHLYAWTKCFNFFTTIVNPLLLLQSTSPVTT